MSDHSTGLGAEFPGFFSIAHVKILYPRASILWAIDGVEILRVIIGRKE
jgi:hypothetical protein